MGRLKSRATICDLVLTTRTYSRRRPSQKGRNDGNLSLYGGTTTYGDSCILPCFQAREFSTTSAWNPTTVPTTVSDSSDSHPCPFCGNKNARLRPMAATWRGALSFGRLSVPIRLDP